MGKTENKVDWSKVSEYEQALNEYSAAKFARIKVFDPREIVRNAKQVREIVDEDLGTIRYVILSYDDATDIAEKYTDNKERSMQYLFRQLAPANEGLKVEDIRKMPYEVVVRLLLKLQREGSFFPPKTPKPSPNGSMPTQEPKTSA